MQTGWNFLLVPYTPIFHRATVRTRGLPAHRVGLYTGEGPQNYKIQRWHRSSRHICPSLKIYKENPYLHFYYVKKFSLGRVGGDLQFFTTVKCKQTFLEVGGAMLSIFIITCQFPLPRMGGMFRNNKKCKKVFPQNIHFLILHGPGPQQIFPGICLCLLLWLMSSTLSRTTSVQSTLCTTYLMTCVLFDFLFKHVSDILSLLPKGVSETVQSEIWPYL